MSMARIQTTRRFCIWKLKHKKPFSWPILRFSKFGFLSWTQYHQSNTIPTIQKKINWLKDKLKSVSTKKTLSPVQDPVFQE
jgi:hypothetical protein